VLAHCGYICSELPDCLGLGKVLQVIEAIQEDYFVEHLEVIATFVVETGVEIVVASKGSGKEVVGLSNVDSITHDDSSFGAMEPMH